MIYSELGNNTQGLEYKDDPLAKTIAPDYEKLSMSAWGIPQLDEMDKFAPKMDENLDTVPDEYSQYLTNFQDLTSTAQKFMKLGFDITKPSLDPRENAAHMEWLQKFNSNTELGKKLQQSRKMRDAYENKYLGQNGVWTNPIGGEILTGLDKYALNPDVRPLEQLVSNAKHRELFTSKDNLQQAKQEYQEDLEAIDSWEQSQPAEFAQQAKQRADLARTSISNPMFDDYKSETLDLKKRQQSSTEAYQKARISLGQQGIDLAKWKEENKQIKDNLVTGQFPAIVENLINNEGENTTTFGKIKYDPLTQKPIFEAETVFARKAKDVPNIKVSGKTGANPNDVLLIVKHKDGTITTYNKNKPDEFQQFMTDYAPGHSFIENTVKSALGTYGLTQDDLGEDVITPDFTPAAVSKKTTSGTSNTAAGANKTSIKNITSKAEFDALPSGSKFIRNGKQYIKD